MRDSVPSVRYSSVCNVLRQWRIWLIPTYRVYRLYDNFITLTPIELEVNLMSFALGPFNYYILLQCTVYIPVHVECV